MYHVAPRLAFVGYWSGLFIYIYDHRHVDFTTASNTVTSSGFPPKVNKRDDIIILTGRNHGIFFTEWLNLLLPSNKTR